MKVVADTSPLCYLVLIDCIDLLPNLYDKVIIPPAVFNELSAPKHQNKLKTGLLILLIG